MSDNAAVCLTPRNVEKPRETNAMPDMAFCLTHGGVCRHRCVRDARDRVRAYFMRRARRCALCARPHARRREATTVRV